MTTEHPKLFISYSWTSHEHEQWVINLATELQENGVDVILDKWELKEGHDAHAFMEKMVTDPSLKKVALICDRLYAEKADGRSGGVGTETQIISPEIYTKADQNKFVAIVVEKNEKGEAFLPVYYKSRIYIDLSDADLYAKNFEQLLRWVFDKPFYVKPDIGKKPAFLSEVGQITLGTSAVYRRALDAIRNNKVYWKGALTEYFDTFSKNLENYRITSNNGEFDDKVVESIEQFLPYRNEAIEIFLALAQYLDTNETREQLHRFFESLIPYMKKPEHITAYREWDFDNYKFIVHELFLYAVASFLKYERFESVSYLLRHLYYLSKASGENMMSFAVFREHLRSLEHRNTRLKLNRISVRADLLERRAKASGLPFQLLMQTDFTLFIRDCLDVIRNGSYQEWWPETLVYIGRYSGAFEIFARAQSKEYFEKVKRLFDIENKDELGALMGAFKERKLRVPSWDFTSVNPADLIGYDKLATKP